jgi:TRAP-type C4-dicarboxylate transport system permease large subunit
MILEMIATYLMIGVIFIILVDWATTYADKRGLPVPPNANFNDAMRIFTIIFWPIGLIFFIKGYIQERFFNNKTKNK